LDLESKKLEGLDDYRDAIATEVAGGSHPVEPSLSIDHLIAAVNQSMLSL
jgi:hypothetical protein